MKRIFKIILIVVFSGVFAFSAYKAAELLYRSGKEAAAFAELANDKAEAASAGLATDNSEAASAWLVGDKDENALSGFAGDSDELSCTAQRPGAESSVYDYFKKKNADYFGWLSIPGTKLNYPVMHTPYDPEYYIHRAFDGSPSASGVPFVGADFNEAGKHIIVYGHNMKNGTMFAVLHKYADQAFYEEHPVIYFDTFDGVREYRVIGAFYSEAYDSAEQNVFKYHQCIDLSDRESFEEYVNNVKKASLYNTNADTSYGGDLLTLSTCSYHKKNGRFVVVGYCGDR